MNEKSKNELMFIQNDILLDIKKVENKLESKIFKVSSSFDDLQEKINKKIEFIENDLEILIEKTETLKEGNLFEKQVESKMNLLNKKIDDYFSRIDSKVIILQTNLKDSCYKYDKTFNSNFIVPGLIGERSQYPNLKAFLESANKKINESLRMKEQQSFDFKKYKEKLEEIVQKSKEQLQTFEKNFDALSKENENQCQGRYAIIGEKLNKLKLENEKYSIELVNKCNNLDGKLAKVEEILNNSLKQYNEELKIFKGMFNDMNNKVKAFEEQYNNFQENIKSFNGLNKNVQDIQSSLNKFDLRFNQINNKFLVIKKNMNDKLEVIKYRNNINNIQNDNSESLNIKTNNFYSPKSNFIEFFRKKEEEEENNFLNFNNSKKLENIEENGLNNENDKLAQKEKNTIENNIINESNKKKYKSKRYSIDKNYIKMKKTKNSFFDDSYEYTKINDIIFDSEFLTRTNYLCNANINEYYSQNYRIKRFRNLYNNRIKSGRISQYPLINNENNTNINDEQNVQLKNKKNNYKLNQRDFDIKENLKEDYEIKKDSNIFTNNIFKSQNYFSNKLDYDSAEGLFSPGHKYLYLDEKINILSNVTIDSINKLIFEVNNLKNKSKQKSSDDKNKDFSSFRKKKLKYSLSDKNVLFNSLSNKDVSKFQKMNIENQTFLNSKFKMKDNEKK